MEQGQHSRHNADGQQHNGGDDNRAEGEHSRRQVEANEASLLHLLVGHVHGIEYGLNSVVGAPQRDRQADQKPEAERLGVFRHEGFQLLLDNFETCIGQQAPKIRDLVGNGDGISDESIKGHERGQRWKKSKKQIERYAGRNQHDAVLVNLRPDPPPDILPGNSSELRWPVRAAAPISLLQQSLS